MVASAKSAQEGGGGGGRGEDFLKVAKPRFVCLQIKHTIKTRYTKSQGGHSHLLRHLLLPHHGCQQESSYFLRVPFIPGIKKHSPQHLIRWTSATLLA